MLVIVVGLTGVGKTTVIETAESQQSTPAFTTVNYGDVLLDIATQRGLVETRDELTEIEPETYTELQEQVPQTIANRADGGLHVLDTHAALDTPSGYRPGLPAETLNTLNPDTLVFIEARPDEIRERRAGDSSRDRDVKPVQELQEHQQTAQQMAITGAVLAGCPYEAISNRDGRKHEAAKRFGEVLTEVSGR